MIQNLGPDNLYIDDVDPCTTTEGTQIPAGSAVALGGGTMYNAISEGTSDTRVLGRGQGFFYGTVPV
jgi:hypothetical protein